jgi:hypothetical protein
MSADEIIFSESKQGQGVTIFSVCGGKLKCPLKLIIQWKEKKNTCKLRPNRHNTHKLFRSAHFELLEDEQEEFKALPLTLGSKPPAKKRPSFSRK